MKTDKKNESNNNISLYNNWIESKYLEENTNYTPMTNIDYSVMNYHMWVNIKNYFEICPNDNENTTTNDNTITNVKIKNKKKKTSKKFYTYFYWDINILSYLFLCLDIFFKSTLLYLKINFIV